LKETAAGSRVMLVAACAHAHGARQLVSVGADSEPIVLRIAATQIRPRFTADAHAKWWCQLLLDDGSWLVGYKIRV